MFILIVTTYIFRWKSFNVQWKGFYGCIGSKIKVETYLDFLTANKTLNVKPGCTFSPESDVLVTTDRVINFDGDGLFVVPGIEFGPNSTFSINFRTVRQEGLLFYQSSKVSTRRRRRNTAEVDLSFLSRKVSSTNLLRLGIHSRLLIPMHLRSDHDHNFQRRSYFANFVKRF